MDGGLTLDTSCSPFQDRRRGSNVSDFSDRHPGGVSPPPTPTHDDSANATAIQMQTSKDLLRSPTFRPRANTHPDKAEHFGAFVL